MGSSDGSADVCSSDLRTQVSARAAGNSEGPNGLRLGQNVRHETFGEGTVLSFDGDGERTRIEVRFKSSGTKRLLLSFAHLQASCARHHEHDGGHADRI